MSWKANLRRGINNILEPAGFSIARFSPEMAARRMESPRIRARQAMDFLQQLNQALAGFPALETARLTEADVKGFMDQVVANPVRQTRGGGGFNAAMLLWAICRLIEPRLVIESGVFRGFSTWVLRQGSPDARQFAFDVSFAELHHRLDPVTYIEADWLTADLSAPNGESALIYFDDHVDQWRRVREAHARGFRWLIFDDSLPVTALHNDGEAASPTIDMLFDPLCADSEEIKWRTECGTFSFTYSTAIAQETRSCVSRHIRLPDLRFVFGYQGANLTLVELHSAASHSD